MELSREQKQQTINLLINIWEQVKTIFSKLLNWIKCNINIINRHYRGKVKYSKRIRNRQKR